MYVKLSHPVKKYPMNKIYCDTGSRQVVLHHVALRRLLCHSAWSQYYGYDATQYVTPPNPNTTPLTYRLDLGYCQEKTLRKANLPLLMKTQRVNENTCVDMLIYNTCFATSTFLLKLYCALKPL